MRSVEKGNLAFAITVTVGTVVGGVVGYGIGDSLENDRATHNQADLEEIQDRQVALDLDRDVMVADLGEGCMRLMREYLPDGDLAEFDESVVVDDLLREPGLPCGDSATEIRADITNLRAAEVSIAESQAQYNDLEVGEAESEDKANLFAGLSIGALLGLVTGIGVGLPIGDAVERRSQNKNL